MKSAKKELLFHPCLHDDTWKMLSVLTEEKVEQIKQEQAENHNNKLARLGLLPRIDDKHVNTARWDTDKNAGENKLSMSDLSSHDLSEVEKNVIRKGLKYGIKAKRVDTFDILSRFEELAETLDALPIAETKKSKYQVDVNDKNNASATLSKEKAIIISKADKGNAVVIQDLDDYKVKINKLLDVTGKFSCLNRDPTRTREAALHKHLRGLLTTNKIDEQTFKKIWPCGSRAGVLYGLPKILKNGTPLRPIISAIETYNYNLAKHLDKLLKPLVIDKYTLIDTYDLVNKIVNLNTNKVRYMVSFDVESLFTNVPTAETIELILDLAFPGHAQKFH